MSAALVANGPSPARAWKRWLLIAVCSLILLLVVLAAALGALVFKYNRVVSAGPGELQTRVRPGEAGRWVNPFIGTGGVPWVCGNNSPAAMVPFGMVRLGPDTASMLIGKRAVNTSGYYYGDDQLAGFSHTRLNGTGATDGGHFLVAPSREAADPTAWRAGRTIRFSHHDEVAFPGYYAVDLPQTGVLAELTATARVGVHRYTFTGPGPAHLWIDVSSALGRHRSTEGKVRVRPERSEIEGQVRTFGTFASRYGGLTVYFAARLSHPLAGFSSWNGDAITAGQTEAEGDRVGVDLVFPAAQQAPVITLHLAISHVSVENARANLQAEGEKTFDQVVADAQQQWEERLARIRVEGGSARERRIFSTALYRAFQMPTRFTDANGEYTGFDRKVHQAHGFDYFTDLSLWDTFRTVHPLYTLIAPQEQRDMIVSLTRMLAEGGWLPRWPAGCGYSNSMLGTPADIVIAEAFLKGIHEFDVESAYTAMRRTALEPTPPGAAFSGRRGVEHYVHYGYCPSDLMKESVSRTFEFGWADRAISNLAQALGRTNDAALFRAHSAFYRNLWNAETQYFQPRDSGGKFFEPFKPLLLTYLDRKGAFTKDYVEGSALQWRWGAPYDADGMISLFKSRDYFVEELNGFFAKASPALGRWNPGPYYWHGNQPDIHAAYLFNHAGRPDLTQKWVRWILQNKYTDTYDGLDGNDDGGTLSAWYVFSALGFYPVAGTDLYELGAPLFEKAEIKLGDGKQLTVLAENAGPDRSYVEKVWLNDRALDRTWIRHAEIRNGGTLRCKMSATPTKPVRR